GEATEEGGTEEESTEEESTEEEATEEADLMDAMMSKLMEDSFTGGQEISEEPEVVSSDPIICPICNAQNPPGSSMCATCSYQF
ncbi:MAG: hypothetical protein CMB31_06735, partial [Euryarchaeota archaeon]|nr:hypothetical protein [Euryarchaeota archaeon]